MPAKFEDLLRQGAIGESIITKYLCNVWGFAVLPAYEKVIDDRKGPRLFLRDKNLVIPDMLTFSHCGPAVWVEAKVKTLFSWYGRGGYFVTGINYHHYQDYQEVEKSTGTPVLLTFLHYQSKTWPNDVRDWNAPAECPTGLFGLWLGKTPESHRNWSGNTLMIYWRYERLTKLASLSELEKYGNLQEAVASANQ